jgi:SulP family sulfate permease
MLAGDLTAGIVVAVLLIPQSLAYAMLAGLPPHMGLLASVLPLMLYALVGSSAAMSVGPGAITSLMVAQALGSVAGAAGDAPVVLSWLMTVGSGLLLLLMGGLRLGFLSQLMSRPVVQGFTVASALLILVGQSGALLGWGTLGHNLPDMLATAWQRGPREGLHHDGDMLVALLSLVLLWLGRPMWHGLARLAGLSPVVRDVAVRLWPVVVLMAALIVAQISPPWLSRPASLVGHVSLAQSWGWPPAASVSAHLASDWRELAMPTLLLALVGFVSSMSVAQTFALKRGERVDADRELLGLGLGNLGAALLGGMPVTGGLSRSVVNDAAGARSPLSGVFSALLLALLLWPLQSVIGLLPKAALAAVIVVSIANLIEWRGLAAAWRYDRSEAGAFVATAAGVLLLSFEAGLLMGMGWSLAAMVWRHSQPHIAEVGRLPGTAHFRNVSRHEVETLPGVIMVRVDESLDFTNIQRVEGRLCELVHARCDASVPVRHVVLLLSAVNHVDHTAVQALIELDAALADQGMTLVLAEIKGPVMDRLAAAGLDARFDGRRYLSAQQVWDALLSTRREA